MSNKLKILCKCEEHYISMLESHGTIVMDVACWECPKLLKLLKGEGS